MTVAFIEHGKNISLERMRAGQKKTKMVGDLADFDVGNLVQSMRALAKLQRSPMCTAMESFCWSF